MAEMKIGIGLYRYMLNKENYRFAKQAGCTHIIAHLVDYYRGQNGVHGTDEVKNMGESVANEDVWSYESIQKLKNEVEEEGLTLYAIENFAPADWYDVLLDGPKKEEQIERLKQIIRNVGKAGIPVFGYNFSIAGVWGHLRRSLSRGGAVSVGFSDKEGAKQTPIKNGQIWNMTYDENAEGYIDEITTEQLWDRLTYFLNELVPVAEEAGVVLAAHPDDPPLKTLRGTPRLVYQPHLYQKLIDIYPSKSNALEFCMGTIQEMTEGNIYDAIEQYGSQDKLAYVHFRNVKGKVPEYHEVFVDEGDIDMVKALKLLKKHNFDGVLIPDHTPLFDTEIPWHMGMAHAIGYIKGIYDAVVKE
ncbi:mannonate dehydratase [Vallitalea sediminicola]